jgi:leader peptidase (prepilin peptidase)/N-methyltransferase
MKTAGYVILFAYLFVMSIYDIKRKEIQIGISVFTAIILGIIKLYLCVRGEQMWYLLLGGIFPGILLLFVSFCSQKQIGAGDGIVFIINGIVLGFFENMVLLFLSLLAAAVVGTGMLLLKRMNRKDKIPFIPFVFIGYGVMCLWKLFG